MFGRKPRVKSHEQIGRELDALRAAGMRSVFFVDDNLIGNVPQAKSLLRFLAAYQKEHDYTFSFGTEASLNLAQNRELLQKLADETGGRYYKASNAGRLADEISYSEAGITTRETKDLWDMPAVFLLALLLRGSEWMLRRRWGVV